MMPAPRPAGVTSCALMPAAACSSWMRAAMAAALMLLSNICCVSCGSAGRYGLSPAIAGLLKKSEHPLDDIQRHIACMGCSYAKFRYLQGYRPQKSRPDMPLGASSMRPSARLGQP